jgi:hypothetical protein
MKLWFEEPDVNAAMVRRRDPTAASIDALPGCFEMDLQ